MTERTYSGSQFSSYALWLGADVPKNSTRGTAYALKIGNMEYAVEYYIDEDGNETARKYSIGKFSPHTHETEDIEYCEKQPQHEDIEEYFTLNV